MISKRIALHNISTQCSAVAKTIDREDEKQRLWQPQGPIRDPGTHRHKYRTNKSIIGALYLKSCLCILRPYFRFQTICHLGRHVLFSAITHRFPSNVLQV